MGTKKERMSEPDAGPKESESTASELLRFAGTWEGDDFEQCLEDVYKTRGEAKF